MKSRLPLTGIDHVVLLVGDMERATAFYTEVIGCTVDNDLPQFGMRQLRAGAALIDLVDIGSNEGVWARPEVAGERTGALGDTLSFYVRDPDGNQIELSFPPS